MMLARSLLSGTKIARVIRVHSVGGHVESVSLAVLLENSKQFVLAVKTAHRIVADICWIVEFPRAHNLVWNFLFASESERIFEMCSRQARGVGNHGAHMIAKHLVRHPGKKSRIRSTRVSDDHANPASEYLAQAFSFLIEHGRSNHNLPLSSKMFSMVLLNDSQ